MLGARTLDHRVLLCAIASLCALVSPPVKAAEFIELRIPLREGRYYRAHDFYVECNEKLGAKYAIADLKDQDYELSPIEKACLLLLATTCPDQCQADIQPGQLILRVPNNADPQVRERT
jgi:hypothetical protein